MTPYLRYCLSAIRENSAALQTAVRDAGKFWAPRLSGRIPRSVLQTISGDTRSASCRRVEDAEILFTEGFQSLILLRPVVDPEALSRLSTIASKGKLTVVVDHFRHAELLSQAMVVAENSADVLIDVDVGRQVTGVRPGPDSVLLAAAVSRLPKLRLRGIYVDDSDGDRKQIKDFSPLSPEESIGVAQHCQRLIKANGMDCPEIVTGLIHFGLAVSSASVSVVLTCPVSVAIPQTEIQLPKRPGVALICRVLSRPSLEWCVIDAGTGIFGNPEPAAITSPSGATLLHSRNDVSTLGLSGESLDLRIGSEVTLTGNDFLERHDLPTVIAE